VLQLRGKDMRALPLLRRKAALQKELRETERIVYCQGGTWMKSGRSGMNSVGFFYKSRLRSQGIGSSVIAGIKKVFTRRT
jgi:hypothetical protein